MTLMNSLTGKFHTRGMAEGVAQISNLSRLEIGDTADWKSALRPRVAQAMDCTVEGPIGSLNGLLLLL